VKLLTVERKLHGGAQQLRPSAENACRFVVWLRGRDDSAGPPVGEELESKHASSQVRGSRRRLRIQLGGVEDPRCLRRPDKKTNRKRGALTSQAHAPAPREKKRRELMGWWGEEKQGLGRVALELAQMVLFLFFLNFSFVF
jgi:hypothetical protein